MLTFNDGSPYFWHPWNPLGCVNSGDTRVLIFVFDFSASGGFFLLFSNWSQDILHFYWFEMNKSDNITFYSHNGWIFKVIQAVSVVIWKESELISPVCSRGILIERVGWSMAWDLSRQCTCTLMHVPHLREFLHAPARKWPVKFVFQKIGIWSNEWVLWQVETFGFLHGYLLMVNRGLSSFLKWGGK